MEMKLFIHNQMKSKYKCLVRVFRRHSRVNKDHLK